MATELSDELGQVASHSFFKEMQKSSHLSGGSVAYVEAMYEMFLEDSNQVPEEWRTYFGTLPIVDGVGADVAHSTIISHFERLGHNRLKARPERVSTEVSSEHERKQVRVLELINAYRARGHRRAKLDPLGIWEREPAPELQIEYYQLTLADCDTVFGTGSAQFFSTPSAPLRDIIDALESTYCQSIGLEYGYITDAQEKLWVRQRFESTRSHPKFDNEHKRQLLERLTAAEGFERYLHNKYPGTKRFGLEGAESLIPMLHEILQRCGEQNVVETVIGMAHRGRLNVLVNILGKSTSVLFDEFEGVSPTTDKTGDVKYHQGFSSNVMTPGGHMHVALAFNPSHLEIVGPVVEGSVRARQDRRVDPGGKAVVPILIHGDAAFAAQGVVMETFQMSQTRGFHTGGTIHVIVNNQIGFTTSNLDDVRSTEYCTEVAKMVRAPIFHVNGDDVEAVVFVAQIAVDYRIVFGKDVVIDLVCYRRRGHNEAEEPMKTQPIMYQAIHQHPTTRAIYAALLAKEGAVSESEPEQWSSDLRDRLDEGGDTVPSIVQDSDTSLFVDWTPYLNHGWTTPADTSFDRAKFKQLAACLNQVPIGFVLHRQVQRIFEDRHRMTAGAMPINWGYAETMAYATLLDEGYNVRLTGQDVGVGTFSHRHASVYCQKTGERFVPLNEMDPNSSFWIYDSLLSEEAVLAFEYGYATTAPNSLIIWEAQFGDFANGAQVVIDQFVSSGESKWARLCGLVMLLPHGYEGAGPEHSSARLERYLQLCAEHNIQVCLPSTPAQMFHLLRRQMIRPMRRPLIVITPKSLLRDKLAISTLEELTDGKFSNVIGETQSIDPSSTRRLVFCSGKVYYDLLKRRNEVGADDVAIIRIEQLYPFPRDTLGEVIAPYSAIETVVWCQEEPMNQGAWYACVHQLRRVISHCLPGLELNYAGRRHFAAPAGGYMTRHIEHQRALVEDALFG